LSGELFYEPERKAKCGAKGVPVTFVVAKLTDPDAGRLTLFSDTKITHRNDTTFTRQTLANPGQKVVIVDDNVVVGFAGDTPGSAVNRVAELRGRSVGEIECALRLLSDEMNQAAGISKSFLVVARKPESRITVITRGQPETERQSEPDGSETMKPSARLAKSFRTSRRPPVWGSRNDSSSP
jgi:hypothetical protein